MELEIDGFIIAAGVTLFLCVSAMSLAAVVTNNETAQASIVIGGLFVSFVAIGQLVGRGAQRKRQIKTAQGESCGSRGGASQISLTVSLGVHLYVICIKCKDQTMR